MLCLGLAPSSFAATWKSGRISCTSTRVLFAVLQSVYQSLQAVTAKVASHACVLLGSLFYSQRCGCPHLGGKDFDHRVGDSACSTSIRGVSKHFDDEMTSKKDDNWRDQYTTGSVFARDYEDSQGYATNTESMMAYVLDMFPKGFFPKPRLAKTRA